MLSKPLTDLVDENNALRRRIDQLEAALADCQDNNEKLHRLATFPEQNPNLVIETDRAGRIVYMNPVAWQRFPDLYERGAQHPLLRGLTAIIAGFREGERDTVARELDLGDAVFEQKICYTRDGDIVRIRVFAHDITARKRAEEAIQKLAKQIVFAQEEERQRVSRELHDEAGQALTALKISLELMLADVPEGSLRQNLTEAVLLTENTREHIRLLARGLRPPALDTVGLNLTLEDICRDFARRTKLNIQYSGLELPDLSDAVSICLYRFLQEALTNVARHADAAAVRVNLAREGRTVCLSVQDDGKGFARRERLEARNRPIGIGILGMQERLELLGGHLTIHTAVGHGTHVAAFLPLEVSQ